MSSQSSFHSVMSNSFSDMVPLESSATLHSDPAASSPETMTCMWGNCNATFHSLAELVGHVNLQHLRSSSAAPVAIDASNLPNTSLDALSCLWKDCSVYPSHESIPGPSTGNPIDSAFNVLASHLLRDHLGLEGNHTTAHSTEPSPPINDDFTPPDTPKDIVVAHECFGTHICHWQSCDESFGSCDELTVHITNTHVGAGKARYGCFWDGCTRHGEQGFTSKQKICRHIQVRSSFVFSPGAYIERSQSHTGHRPFQCKVCKQNFSEAATLQQHMRRHTQESQ